MAKDSLQKARERLNEARQYSHGAQSGNTGSLKDLVMHLLYAVELIIIYLQHKEEDNDNKDT